MKICKVIALFVVLFAFFGCGNSERTINSTATAGYVLSSKSSMTAGTFWEDSTEYTFVTTTRGSIVIYGTMAVPEGELVTILFYENTNNHRYNIYFITESMTNSWAVKSYAIKDIKPVGL